MRKPERAKKMLHADPSGLGEIAEGAEEGVMGAEASSVMKEEDEEDGEATQAVERRVAGGVGWPVWDGGHCGKARDVGMGSQRWLLEMAFRGFGQRGLV